MRGEVPAVLPLPWSAGPRGVRSPHCGRGAAMGRAPAATVSGARSDWAASAFCRYVAIRSSAASSEGKPAGSLGEGCCGWQDCGNFLLLPLELLPDISSWACSY